MKIFCDFDNTLVDTNMAFIECANDKFGINKTVDDIVSFDLSKLSPNMTREMVDSVFESDDFFNRLAEFNGALDILPKHEVHLCTIGSKKNLNKKDRWLKNKGLYWNHAFLDSSMGFSGKSKYLFDMRDAIQIDDLYSALKYTNASFKILFRNYKDREWNTVDSCSDVYIVDEWGEINEILRWLDGRKSYSVG